MMAKVMIALSVSLDGFIAGPHDGVKNPLGDDGDQLFSWYFDGNTPIQFYKRAAEKGIPVPPFKLSCGSAQVFETLVESTGAVVTGRRTYDIAGAWNGNGPLPGLPLFVVTHNPPKIVPNGESRYTFVTDGVENAIRQAQKAAGEKGVSLMGSSVPQQCLRAGLVDEIQIHLAPVLLGGGVRLFDHLASKSIKLEIVEVINSPGVTHLKYEVVK
jgi:dihydrofolate reductase